jgi:hypothetical protein
MAAELDQPTVKTDRALPDPTPRYNAPAGGWGSVKSLARALTRERVIASAPPALLRQNKPDGFACVSCAWAKPADPHVFEFCESGAKATTWEITSRRADNHFFASHTCKNSKPGPTMTSRNSVGSPGPCAGSRRPTVTCR